MNLHDVEQRLSKVVQPEILERLVYKIRPMVDSYPLTGSGKRSRQDLALENLNGTLKPIFNSYDNTILGKIYIEDISNAKKMNL